MKSAPEINRLARGHDEIIRDQRGINTRLGMANGKIIAAKLVLGITFIKVTELWHCSNETFSYDQGSSL